MAWTLGAVMAIACAVPFFILEPGSGRANSRKKDQYLEGTILNEWGNLPGLIGSKGLFAPDTIKINESRYILEIQTEKGKYVTSIYDVGDGTRSLEALSVAIEKGSRVRFVETKYDNAGRPYGRFGQDRIGGLRSDEIFIDN